MKRTTIIYLVLNAIGIMLFAWFVYRIEALAHAEGRSLRDGVDGITFYTTAVPVFLACVMLSCLWSVQIIWDLVKKKGSGSLKALASVACGWTAAIIAIRFLSS